MPSFSDDFERANGPLGGNWTVTYGSISISSGRMTGSTICACYCNAISLTGDVQASITIQTHGLSQGNHELGLGWDGVGGRYHFLSIAPWAGGTTADLVYYDGGTPHLIGSFADSGVSAADRTYRLERVGTDYTAYCDGVSLGTVSDAQSDAGSYATIVGRSGLFSVAAFSAGDVVAATMAVTPDPVWVGGGPVDMVATLTGATWTPGVPGSSTISVDHGTITDQWTADATHIHFILEPAEYVGTLTFSESEYSLTDEVTATLDPDAAGVGEGCKLTDDGATLVNSTAADYLPGRILTDTHVAHLVGTLNVPNALGYLIDIVRGLYGTPPDFPPSGVTPDPRLDLIWNAVNGGVEQPIGLWTPTTDPPVKVDTENIRATVEALTASYVDLADVVAILGGSPMVYSHADLKTAIDNIDLSSILTKLDKIQPNELHDLTQIVTMLTNLQGVRAETLTSLSDQILALNPSTAPGLAAATAAILGAIGAVALEVAGIATAETADAASSAAAAAGIAGVALTIADIVADLASIAADIAKIKAGLGSETFHPPVWPGLAHVTMGVPQALEGSLVVPGPMHGVRVHIESCDPGTSFYEYDVVRNWRNAGALSFCSDVGDQEQFQPLGWQNGVYVPLHMTEAASCKLHLGRGPVGTITPWSYAP